MKQVLDFALEHKELLVGAGIGVLDFIFAIKSGWKSNGILHWVYVTLTSFKKKPEAPKA